MSKKYITDNLEITDLQYNTDSISVLVQDEVLGSESANYIDGNIALSSLNGSIMTSLSGINYNATAIGDSNDARPRIAFNLTAGLSYAVEYIPITIVGATTIDVFVNNTRVFNNRDAGISLNYEILASSTYDGIDFDGSLIFDIDYTLSIREITSSSNEIKKKVLDLTNMDLNTTDRHNHSNKVTLDKFGEDGSGLPTYNGNAVDTTIAQRDVNDTLTSSDNTISLSAKQGKVLKDVQDTQQTAINLNTAKTSYPGDQDLSGYLLNTTDTLTGSFNIKATSNVFDIFRITESTSDARAFMIGLKGATGTEVSFGSLYSGAEVPSFEIVRQTGKVNFFSDISSTGTILGSNLSGTNTGDQDTTYTAGVGIELAGTEFKINGGSIGGSVDLDTYRATGIFTQNSNAATATGSNWPENNAGILEVWNDDYGNGLHCTQRYKTYVGDNDWSRAYYNGSWSTWRNLAQDTDTTYDLSGYLLNTNDTFTGDLTITGDIFVDGKITQGGVIDKEEWGRMYVSASITNIKELLTSDGTSLPTGGGYRVTGHIDGTGTDQVAVAIFWNENGTWLVNNTFKGGSTSNHIDFLVSGGLPSVKTWHASNYNINVAHERLSLNEDAGTDNLRGYFGSDSYLQWFETDNSLVIPGTVSADNLSGTNTGDQDLSGYLLNTSDTLTGNLTVTNSIITNGPAELYFNPSANALYTPRTTNQWQSATPFGKDWHDIQAFDKNYTTTQYTSTDGTTFSPTTLEIGLFAQQDKIKYDVIASGVQAVRFEFEGVAYNVGRYFQISSSYSSPTPSCSVLIETSADGVAWSTIHTSTGVSFSASSRYYWCDDSIGTGGDNYVRVTIDKGDSGTGLVKLTSLRMLTQRAGDQGQGREDEFPYTWDKNKNISVEGDLTVIGTASASNLSGTNTGDQDLSGYVEIAGDIMTGNLNIERPSGDIGTLLIKGGNNTVTAVGEVNSEINFGSNDGSATGRIGGSIKSITELANGAYVGMGFYTAKQSRVPVLKEGMRLNYDGDLSVVGNISATNLSGTNTGDQDLSSYITTSTADGKYLLNTSDIMSGNLTVNGLTTLDDRLTIEQGSRIRFKDYSSGYVTDFVNDGTARGWEFIGTSGATYNLSLRNTGVGGYNLTVGGQINGDNLSGTNTGDNAANSLYSGLVSNVSTNISVVENATTVSINSSDGTDDSIAGATALLAGVVTNTTQIFGGNKTFNDLVLFNTATDSGYQMTVGTKDSTGNLYSIYASGRIYSAGDIGSDTMTVQNDVEAGSFTKSGGTSSQFLMADGSTTTSSGDFSAQISTLTDADTAFNKAGTYRYSNTTTNTPNDYGTILTTVDSGGDYNGTNNWLTQMAHGTDNVSYLRYKVNADAFTSWRQIAFTDSYATTSVGGTVSTTTQSFAGNKTFTGTVTSNSFVKNGGTSSQFLKANGSVDTGDYLEDSTIEFQEIIALSDETTDLVAGTATVTFRAPDAITVSSFRLSCNTAPTGSTIIVDVNVSGTTMLSTKLSIDASEKTSQTAATPHVISSGVVGDDNEITIDIDQIGSTIAGKGLKLIMYYTRTFIA